MACAHRRFFLISALILALRIRALPSSTVMVLCAAVLYRVHLPPCSICCAFSRERALSV